MFENMKKIINIVFVIAGCLIGTSCSDNDYTENVSSVKVASASTEIEAKGGTGSIAVNSENVVSAYSTESWLTVSVSDKNVSYTAELNPFAESRNALVVVKNAKNDSTIVNVKQYGVVFALDAPSSVNGGDAAFSRSFYLKHNEDVTITTNANWLKGSIEGDSLKISMTDNTLGHIRSGYIKYQIGTVLDSVQVLQCDFDKDIAGDYYLAYKGDDGKTYAYAAQLTNKSLVLATKEFTLTIPVAFDENSISVTMECGDSIGFASNSYIYTIFADAKYEYWTAYNKGLKYTAPLQYDDENGTYGFFAGTFGTRKIGALVFGGFKTNQMSKTNYVGDLDVLYSPYLLKVSSSGAKSKSFGKQLSQLEYILR